MNADEGQPTDRALHHLGRPLSGCSARADGAHNRACPGFHGRDDDLDSEEVPAWTGAA